MAGMSLAGTLVMILTVVAAYLFPEGHRDLGHQHARRLGFCDH